MSCEGHKVFPHFTQSRSYFLAMPPPPSCSVRRPLGRRQRTPTSYFLLPTSYFRARCFARLFMKQQVTVAMMTMPTNKAEETPTIRGMRRRSAAGEARGDEREGFSDDNRHMHENYELYVEQKIGQQLTFDRYIVTRHFVRPNIVIRIHISRALICTL